MRDTCPFVHCLRFEVTREVSVNEDTAAPNSPSWYSAPFNRTKINTSSWYGLHECAELLAKRAKMAPAFVAGAGAALPTTFSNGRLISTRPYRAALTKRGDAHMMAESSGQKQGIFDWLHEKIMHNFSTEFGYETYFKPIEEAREQEMEQIYKLGDKPKE